MTQGHVLIVRVGAMGDVLHALPAATALRLRFPEVALGWVVDPRWAPLLVSGEGHGPVISEVHLADTRLWSRHPASRATLRSVHHLRQALRHGHYRTVVDVQGTLRSAIVGRLAGNVPRWGFADPRESAARFFYTHQVQRCGPHVVQQNAALLGDALGTELEPALPRLPVDREAELWAERKLTGPHERFALLTPSAGWGAKQWPAERFGQLAPVLREMGYAVLVNAPKQDDPLAAAVVHSSNGAAEVVVSDVAQLVAMVRRAAVVVGGDSGPVHLAAALRVPVVALFGPTDPARNGPWGDGPIRILRDSRSITTYKRHAELDAGLNSIGVNHVADAVQDLLRESGTPDPTPFEKIGRWPEGQR